MDISKQYCLVFILSLLPFIFTLKGEFVFDDSEAIETNADVVSNSTLDIFTNDFWGNKIVSNTSHKSYRPLTVLSFRLNYILSGHKLNAYHFKITNLLLHSTNCILLLYFLSALENILMLKTQHNHVPLLTSLLFSTHPVHTEAVCGIVGRADILCNISFVIALLFYLKSLQEDDPMFVIFTGVFATISMLFKEPGITVLGICFVFEYIYLKIKMSKVLNKSYKFKNTVLRLSTITLFGILLMTSRWFIMGMEKPTFQPTENPAAFTPNLFTRITSYNYIYFLNFMLLVWPEYLCFDWSMGCIPLISSYFDYRLLFILFLYCYGLFNLQYLLKKNCDTDKRSHILGLALLIIPFLPATNIFMTVGFVIAERILYIPSIGHCLFIAVGTSKIINKTNYRKLTICLYIFLLATYSLKCWQRSIDWQTNYRLYLSGLKVCPNNAKVHYNIAKTADAMNLVELSQREYEEALRIEPNYPSALNNLANLLRTKNQFNEAEKLLKKAITIKKDFPAAWMNLGVTLSTQKRDDEAMEAYITALTYKSNYPNCYFNLGNLYLRMNKLQEAKQAFLKTIELDPKHTQGWTNILTLTKNLDETKQVLELIPLALKRVPDSGTVHFAIANIYGKLSQYDKAEYHFKKTIELFGSSVDALHYTNLGVLYHRVKKYDEAQKMYLKALDIDPKYRSAINNMKLLEARK